MRVALRACAALAIASCVACGPAPLPDADSPGARAYVARCGSCHAPYQPREMTAAMWETQVAMMDAKIRQAGLPPLAGAERERVIAYLRDHAGHR